MHALKIFEDHHYQIVWLEHNMQWYLKSLDTITTHFTVEMELTYGENYCYLYKESHGSLASLGAPWTRGGRTYEL